MSGGATNGLSHPAEKPRSCIIQCPSCQTKFAIDTGTVQEQQTPRFHCSRCDHVFEMDLGLPSTVSQSSESPLKKEGFKALASEPLSISGAKSKSLELPKTVEKTSTNIAPHETTSGNDDDIAVKQMEFGFIGGARSVESASHRDGALRDDLTSFDYREARNLDLGDDARPAKVINHWKAFYVVGLPIVAFLLVLMLAGAYLRSTPNVSLSISESLFPLSPHIPPTGLFIKRSRFKRVVLSSGESVQVISGFVQNNSDRTIADATIEGLVFDDNGNLVTKTRSSIASGLEDARLRSLSSDTIQKLQGASAPSRFSLAPNTEQSYVIVLFGSDLDRAKYYSARIYSVRY